MAGEMNAAELLALLINPEAGPGCWAALVERHGRRLWAVCRAAAGAGLADDAFQEGLIAIRRSAGRFRPGPDPEASAVAWMVTVVHRTAVDLVRREARRGKREGSVMPVEPIAVQLSDHERDEVARHALLALEQLPERHREVIRLRLLGGLDSAQTASVLGCPADQVRVRFQRALEQLRKRCSGAQAGVMPLAMLEDCLHRALIPPAVLSPSAQAATLASFTTPVATGLSTGAIMAFSALGCGVVATLALTISSTFSAAHAVEQGATPGVIAPAPASDPPPAAPTAAQTDAQTILAAWQMKDVLAIAVQRFAKAQGVDAAPDDLKRASLAAVTADGVLMEDASIIAQRYDHGQMADYLRFLASPAGRALGATMPVMEDVINNQQMYETLQAVRLAAKQVLDHPDAALPAAPAGDPGLAMARAYWLAAGFENELRDQLVDSLRMDYPKTSELVLSMALDRAIAGRPDWLDPVLRVYQEHLSQTDMEEGFVFFNSPAGRHVSAAMVGILPDMNALVIKRIPQLIAMTRANLAPTPATAPVDKGF